MTLALTDTETLTFHAALSQAATATEEALDRLLPPGDLAVTEAMRYATLGGGKRLRAFFVIETAAMFGVRLPQSSRVAAAIEMIHAYSLIHDDLPAMDDDDTRRGKPTVHKKWDDATAILAGDALQALAFEVLTSAQTSADANVRIKLVQRLAEASGAAGMVGGQALDIAAERSSTPLDIEQVTQLQALKTGALITFSLEAGAILGKSNGDALVRYAADVGLAFQIQ
ncbi:MAG: polyprenyl synthetase family protein, partial [Pseudomonadota bacterium]